MKIYNQGTLNFGNVGTVKHMQINKYNISHKWSVYRIQETRSGSMTQE